MNAGIADVVDSVTPLDCDAKQEARDRLDALTKPRGSLGRLEELAVQLAGITGRVRQRLSEKAVVLMAGDHGVVEEGVSAFHQSVTAQMVANFLEGGAAISVLANNAGARVIVVDVGVATDLAQQPDRLLVQPHRLHSVPHPIQYADGGLVGKPPVRLGRYGRDGSSHRLQRATE